MAWFDDLKTALPRYYPGGAGDRVVGYLRGASDRGVWIAMQQGPKAQMIVLGSAAPTQAEWDAAGVGGRGGQATITIDMLAGFIILYDGFMYRPWGGIYLDDADCQRTFPGSLASWKRNNKWLR